MFEIIYSLQIQKNKMANIDAIRKQIQYYMSDKNLQIDNFFYDKISEAKEGFIEVDLLLNCNKIKKLNVKTHQELVKAIQTSEALQLHAGRKLFRRKQTELPDRIVKKVKTDEKKEQTVVQQPEEVNPYRNIETVIFTLTTQKQASVNFKFIQEGLVRTFNVHPPYTRFSKIEGNFAVNKIGYTEELRERMQKEGLKVGDVTFKIKLTEGKDLQEFKQKHEFHYQGIVERLKKEHEAKIKQERRNRKRNKPVEFTFGGQKYTDINKLKSLFKNILCRAPNNVPLRQAEDKLLRELLTYHEKGPSKSENLKHFVVDIHPEHKDTRCFFVVRNDNTRQDFSAVKCIANLEEKHQHQ